MVVAVQLAVIALSLPVLAWASYLFVLVLLSRRFSQPDYGPPHLRFDIVVPAHDEALSIASTVQSLRAVDYPADLFRVVVVADNCSDDTAERARDAGATVLVRHDPERRGKGYALQHAFEHRLTEGDADAVVVVDADTTVTPNLLRAFAARIEAGAEAIQAHYGVRNRTESWRTRLMVIALSLFHGVRSLARERLRVSAGLRGNGMAFTRKVLTEVPHEAFSIVEDVEYGIRLARAGHRVFYVDDAEVFGEMAATEQASRTQRERWEVGRFEMARRFGLPLLKDAVRRRSLMLFDLAADLLVPPLSYVVAAAFLGLALSAAVALWTGSVWLTVPFGLCAAMLTAYVLRGIQLADVGIRGFVDLLYAPVYMGWKFLLAARGRRTSRQWVRTRRSGEGP